MKEIQCKRCFFFTPEWCPKKHDSLDPDLIRDCQYFRIKTNADRIRNMSDEELAEWLGKIQYDTAYYFAGEDTQKFPYPDGWLDWLKEEVEE